VFRLLAALVVPVVVALAGLALVPGADPDGTRLVPVAELPPGPRVPGADALSAAPEPRAPTSALSRSGTLRHAEEGADLEVTLDSLRPAVVPARRPVTLQGRVTNRTDETWSAINVAPCTSRTPITTGSELQAAVESAPEMVVCRRTGFFVPIGDLEPGETRRYTLRVPRDQLGIPEGVEGVYWLNVHVLGTSSAGRDQISDGRARTFIPAVERGHDPVRTSVVLPVRQGIQRESDGSLRDPDQWAADLAAGGRLHNVLRLAGGARGTGAPLLVDPAVVDAARQLARGNPPRALGGPDEEPEATTDAGARAARAWLERLQSVAGDHTVLALPYGDIDVAAVGAHEPSIYARARRQSEAALGELGIRSTPAIVPPTGLLNMDGLRLADDETVVVLSEDALPEPYASDDAPPATIAWDGRRIGLYDPGVSLGGPGPNERLGALAVRQRVLAEASLRAIVDDDRPLLVNLPGDTDPGTFTGAFFRALDQPFLALREHPVESELDPPEIDEPAYPKEEADTELEEGNIDRVERLVRAGTVLDDILVDNDTLGTQTSREGLSWLSYAQREDPFAAATAAEQATSWVQRQLRSVTIETPPFVILSADSGPFPVTVTNDLDESVQLRLRAHADTEVVIRAPETITLPPGASQTINLQAQATSIGVHNVTLVATDTEGRPIGTTAELNVRSNQVGVVIWVVMGVGVGILFLAIAIRLVRRVRRRSTT